MFDFFTYNKSFDPLRDQGTIQYWAKNAKLFLSNFSVFYESGEAKDDYYQHFGIKQAKKKIQDEEVMAFSQEHLDFCLSYADSPRLIYNGH